MDTVPCHISEWYQLGRDALELVSNSSVELLPRNWKGDYEMVSTDVMIHAKGSCSAKYQSVHFGVELKVKDVPLEEAESYQEALQEMCFQRLDKMEEEGQKLLSVLVEET